MLIRPGRLEDIVWMMELEKAAATAPHWTAREYGHAVTGLGAKRSVLVAEEGHLLIAFAVGRIVAGEGELESVVVAQSARGRGVGRALCTAVMNWARVEGADRMFLEVRVGSAGVIRLYRKLGFVEVGRRTEYYRSPVDDAVMMECELGEG